jgi:hypothetical protein
MNKSLRQIRQSLTEGMAHTTSKPVDGKSTTLDRIASADVKAKQISAADAQKVNKMARAEKNAIEFQKTHPHIHEDSLPIFKKGEVVKFNSLKGKVSDKEFAGGHMIAHSHDGESATIIGIPMDGYYDVKFNDGKHLQAISGVHLTKPVGEETVTEVLSKSDPVEKWISDFVHSKNDKFKGKSKQERIKMALGAYYASKKNEAVTEDADAHEQNEIDMTTQEMDEIADIADDLYNIFPKFDECPAWVQHKVAAIHAEMNSIYDFYKLELQKKTSTNQ